MSKRERIAVIQSWNQWYRRKVTPKKRIVPHGTRYSPIQKHTMLGQFGLPVIYMPEAFAIITNIE